MKSTDHYHATLNYIHHNPVKHGYVGKWSDWAWSSTPEYFAEVARKEAERVWHSYPLDRYGHG